MTRLASSLDDGIAATSARFPGGKHGILCPVSSGWWGLFRFRLLLPLLPLRLDFRRFGISKEGDIPFSSLTDPADLARAQAALEIAWRAVEAEVRDEDRDECRIRLKYIISSFALVAVDENDLARRVIERFRRRPTL